MVPARATASGNLQVWQRVARFHISTPLPLPSPNPHDAALSSLGSPHAASAGVSSHSPNPSGTPLPNASAGSLPPSLHSSLYRAKTRCLDASKGARGAMPPNPTPPATSQVRGLRPDASRIRAPKPGVKRAHPPPGRILCVTATTLAAGRWRPALRYSDIFARLGRATGQAGKRHTWTCGPRSGQNQWHACVIAERLADEYAQNSGDLMGRGVRPPGGEFLRYHGDEKGPVGIEAARDMAGVLSRSIPVCTYKFCIVVGMHSTYTPGE